MVQKFGVDDLRGVIAVTPTPALPGAAALTARDTVDLDESDRMIRALVTDGVDGIITNGTLGEMATLTLAEWQAFAACVADAVSDTAPDLPLFVGATAPNTRDTIDRIHFLRDLGVRGVILGRPMWSELGADTLLAFYRGVAGLFPDMAIVLYDNPEAFKGPIPSAAYAALSEVPQIIGAKYIAITPKFAADMAGVGNRLRLLPLESDWLAAHTLHPETALGCWSSSALCGPEPVLALRDAIQAGDVDTARHLTRRIEWTYEPFLARTNFPEFSKYNITLEKLRFDEAGYVTAGPARPPYHVVPGPYADGARENGRRWRGLVGEVRGQYS
ncbi:dihydrodipicolinate synthase family protein [Amycolatopsis sp. NPDC005232]|uniref:dihydrodipicolinate synthase family protein n=1 Tax=Amycolatopsis sp. NPDC005232 TaxID=3157027 RepID=UPI0033B54BF1